MKHVFLTVTVMFAASARTALAQDPPPDSTAQRDSTARRDSTVDSTAGPAMTLTTSGVYTAEQAAKGAQTYRKHCTSCHAPVGYTGLAFRRVWNGRAVFDFFDVIRTTMPNDEPGKLSREEYAEIMAYLLKLNGLPSGEKPLPGDDEPLRMIQIDIPPKAPPP